MAYDSAPPPAQPPGQPPYGAWPPAPQQHGQAVTALVLGILSLVVCGLLGIPAYIIGRRAEREVLASQGRLTGDGMAKAGWICGLIAMILIGAAVLFFLLFFGGALLFSTTS